MSSMNASMPMPGSDVLTPLDPNQFDLNNATQAADFLSQLLDDSILQYDAQAFSRYFWYGVVVFIGFAAAHNYLWKGSLFLRKRAARANRTKPVAPATFLGRLLSATTYVCRIASYSQFTPSRAKLWIQVPPFGTVILLGLYLAFVLALEFINNDVAGAQYFTSRGIRAGWLSIAQIPLLVLLAGKNNLIGLVTGLSYARLNILHRWVSRTVLLTVILHVAYFNYSWNKYGISSLETSIDTCVPTGIAAFALLGWLNISTIAPFRNFSYEIFVIQHLLTFFGFIVAIMYHLPSTARETRRYIWVPIGLYLFDRLTRTMCSVWNNSNQGRATVVSIDAEVTRIRVRGSRVHKWAPGSFVLLSIPYYGLAQSHPASIVSTPTSHDGDLIFLLRSHKGFTKKLSSSPAISKTSGGSSVENEKPQSSQESHRAFIDGPYGGAQGDMGAFDTVLLVAGSTGITFTLSILTDLSARVGSQKLPLRRVELVWAVKRQFHTTWVSDELGSALPLLHAAGIETKFRLFVTCDDRVTDSVQSTRCLDCRCSVSDGQTCCCADNSHITEVNVAPHAHGNKKDIPGPIVQSGRPNIDLTISELLPETQGEMAVAVCGPLGLSAAVRRSVVKSMTAKQGIYLHVEGFAW